MAFPPYLTTIVWPEREWREEEIVMAFLTNELSLTSSVVDANEDEVVVEMSCWWMCRRVDNDVGAKP